MNEGRWRGRILIIANLNQKLNRTSQSDTEARMPRSQNKAGAAVNLHQANTPMWKIFDMPHTYAIAVIFACAVYVDSLCDESIVNKTLISTKDLLIDIGRTGPISITKNLFGIESTFIAKLIFTVVALLSSYLGYLLIDKFVVGPSEESHDANVP